MTELIGIPLATRVHFTLHFFVIHTKQQIRIHTATQIRIITNTTAPIEIPAIPPALKFACITSFALVVPVVKLAFWYMMKTAVSTNVLQLHVALEAVNVT